MSINSRTLKESNRIIIVRNIYDDELLFIKTDLSTKEYTCCINCGTKSSNYYLLPYYDRTRQYCYACYLKFRRETKWKTEYYTPTFDNIILYVINNRHLFDNEDLNLIDEFFTMKTNKSISIQVFIDKYCKGGK